MTITEFLLARIAEDEATASNPANTTVTGNGGWYHEQTWLPWKIDVHQGPDAYGCGPLLHIDPARVLAECKAKRRIVGRHHVTPADHWDPNVCEGCGWTGDPDIARTDCAYDTCPELADLASVYAEHPDYDASWAL